jgi:hypothetical protein
MIAWGFLQPVAPVIVEIIGARIAHRFDSEFKIKNLVSTIPANFFCMACFNFCLDLLLRLIIAK